MKYLNILSVLTIITLIGCSNEDKHSNFSEFQDYLNNYSGEGTSVTMVDGRITLLIDDTKDDSILNSAISKGTCYDSELYNTLGFIYDSILPQATDNNIPDTAWQVQIKIDEGTYTINNTNLEEIANKIVNTMFEHEEELPMPTTEEIISQGDNGSVAYQKAFDDKSNIILKQLNTEYPYEITVDYDSQGTDAKYAINIYAPNGSATSLPKDQLKSQMLEIQSILVKELNNTFNLYLYEEIELIDGTGDTYVKRIELLSIQNNQLQLTPEYNADYYIDGHGTNACYFEYLKLTDIEIQALETVSDYFYDNGWDGVYEISSEDTNSIYFQVDVRGQLQEDEQGTLDKVNTLIRSLNLLGFDVDGFIDNGRFYIEESQLKEDTWNF